MKHCPYCGSEMPEEMSFCLACMRKLNTETDLEAVAKKNTHIKFVNLIGVCVCLLLLVLSLVFLKPYFPSTSDKQSQSNIDFEAYMIFRENLLAAHEALEEEENILLNDIKELEPLLEGQSRCDIMFWYGQYANVYFMNDGSIFGVTVEQNDQFYLDSCHFINLVLKSYSKNYSNDDFYDFLTQNIEFEDDILPYMTISERNDTEDFDGFRCKIFVRKGEQDKVYVTFTAKKL